MSAEPHDAAELSSPLGEDHPPGRSGTPTAWITLLLIALLVSVGLFSDKLVCGAIRTGIALACWHRGETLRMGRLFLNRSGDFEVRNVEWSGGPKEHRSSLKSDWVIVRTTPVKDLLFVKPGEERRLIRELQTGTATALVDIRRGTGPSVAGKNTGPSAPSFLPFLCPGAIRMGPMNAVVIASSSRLEVNGLRLNLPARWPGTVSFQSAALDLGSSHRKIPAESALALWEGDALLLGEIGLGDGLVLKELSLKPRSGGLEFGVKGMIGKGLLRGDGFLGGTDSPERLEVTLVGEHLGLETLSAILGKPTGATGTIDQARVTFRGDTGRPLEADGSVRLVSRNFRWEGRGWESLRLAATLTGRTLSLTELTMRQGENELEAEGRSKLPSDWRQALRAPFTASFHARLEDAGSIATLAGDDLGRLGGALFLDGELHGADNRAEGYCNFSGAGTKVRDLTFDWIKGCLLFEGPSTRLAYLEARADGDRVLLEGSFSNSRPHAYKGRAEVDVRNLSGRLAQLGITTAASIGGGAVNGIWEGSGGGAGEDSGTFQAKVSNWVSKWTKAGMSGSFTGLYAPGKQELTKAEFFQDELKLSLKLLATKDDLAVSEIKAVRGGKDGKSKTMLEGGVSVPVNAADLWRSGDPLRTLSMDRPVRMDLRLSGIRAEEMADLLGQRAPFTGLLEGTLAATGTPAAPRLTGSLRIGRFTPAGGESVGDLSLSAETSDGGDSLRAELGPADSPKARGVLSLPLRFALQGDRIGLAGGDGKVTGTLELVRFPLAGWTGWLGAGDRLALKKATLDGNISVSGTMGTRALEGSFLLKAEEAGVFGPHHLRDLALPVTFHGASATVTNGSATYAGKALSLAGGLDWGAETREGNLRISGTDLPVILGHGIATTGEAALTISVKGSDEPVLGGKITMRPVMADLGTKVIPSFAPPGIPLGFHDDTPGILAGVHPMRFDLSVVTEAGAGDETSSPLLLADLHVTGDSVQPSIDGKVTLQNQTLRLPAGDFVMPEASLIPDREGVRIDRADAVGFTGEGLCSMSLSGSLARPAVALSGMPGTLAPDLLMALSTGRGASPMPTPLLQGASWIRQHTLFPVAALPWTTFRDATPTSGALGFYGAPWVWNLEVPTAAAR